jgi:ubiquitin carboxyl-terminal hydrolase L3
MDAEDEVDVHFVYFAEWQKNSHLYEMDEDRKVPLDTGVLLRPQEDNFAAGGSSIVRKFIEREKGGDEISGW